MALLTKGGQSEEQTYASQKLKYHKKEANNNIWVVARQMQGSLLYVELRHSKIHMWKS